MINNGLFDTNGYLHKLRDDFAISALPTLIDLMYPHQDEEGSIVLVAKTAY